MLHIFQNVSTVECYTRSEMSKNVQIYKKGLNGRVSTFIGIVCVRILYAYLFSVFIHFFRKFHLYQKVAAALNVFTATQKFSAT